MGNFIFGGGSKSLNKGGLLTCRGRKALPLSFTLQPQAKTVDEYSLATFSCEVTGGTAPYAYQWKKNGTNVGTNIANLSFTAAAADKNASITVVVTDSVGSVITSTPVVLGVTSYRYILDGVTQHHSTAQRLINIAADIDVSVKLQHVAAITLYEAIFGQTQSTAVAFTEFLVKLRDSGAIYVTVGGNTAVFVNKLPTSNINIVLRITLVGTSLKMYWDGTLIETLPFARGAVTEPAAVTRIGGVIVSGGGLVGFKGSTSKATINGTYLQLDNKALGENQMGDIPSAIVNYNAANWVAV